MPDLSWSTLFAIAFAGVILYSGVSTATFIVRMNRVISLLSYTTFMTPCEIALRYKEKYRISSLPQSILFLDEALPHLEARKLVVGRDANWRCFCEREYCLAANIRRRRRVERARNADIPDGKIA